VRWFHAETTSPIEAEIGMRTDAVWGCRVRPFVVRPNLVGEHDTDDRTVDAAREERRNAYDKVHFTRPAALRR